MTNTIAKPPSRRPRILALVGAAIVLLSFLVPAFHITAHAVFPPGSQQLAPPIIFEKMRNFLDGKMHIGWAMPWNLWWEIAICPLALAALGAIILDGRRRATAWAFIGIVFAVLVLALTGLVLGLCGKGFDDVSVSEENGGPSILLARIDPRNQAPVAEENQDDVSMVHSKYRVAEWYAEMNGHMDVAAIPIGAATTLLGGGLALAGGIMLLWKRESKVTEIALP